jgi:hypothetical protein
MKLARAAIATALFIVVLTLVYYIHVTYFRVNVVLYAAIADLLIALAASGTVLFAAGYFQALGGFEKLQLVVIWFLMGYALAISVPTVIDRSLSFYILEKIQQRGGGIKQQSLEQVFTQEYIREHRLVAVRLTEQLESGTIEIQNGCVKLTKKGEKIATFGRYFRRHWLPKKRLLMGTYSDDLTDPFRSSVEKTDYTCE